MTDNFSIRTNKVTFALVAVAAVDDANNYGDGEDGRDGDENGVGTGKGTVTVTKTSTGLLAVV